MIAQTKSLAHARPVSTVLVVDDDAEHRSSLRGLLERAGFSVLEADNGHAALEICRHRPPSLVLLDDVMPVMDGAAFLDAKQLDSRITFIPVIVLSSTDLSLGARVVRQLRKPVQPEILLSIIRAAIGAARWG